MKNAECPRLLTVSDLGLTDANWEQPRPAVVLLADPHRGANEPESGVALVHHRVSVAEVLPDHLAVNDLLRNTTVTSCGAVRRNKKKKKKVPYYKSNPFSEKLKEHYEAIIVPGSFSALLSEHIRRSNFDITDHNLVINSHNMVQHFGFPAVAQMKSLQCHPLS